TVSFTAASSIRFNSATTSGGGLALLAGFTGVFDADNLLTLADNTLSAANAHGAGVAVLGGSFTMDGGSIVRNTSAQSGTTGGGIYQAAGLVTLNGVTVGGSGNANSAALRGGGIDVVGGNLTFSGATSVVSFNTSATGAGL